MLTKEFLRKETTLAAIVCIGLIILAAGTQTFFYRHIKSDSRRLLSPLTSADLIQFTIIDSTLVGKTLKIATLKNQYLICGEIKRYYKELGVNYYLNYYAFSICSIVFVTLLTIAVFLVANKGWQNSSLVLRSFLLTTIVLSSVYYFLPNVLSNKDNITNNMAKVIVFQKIQSDILTFSNRINEVKSSKIDSVIANNYEKISANLDFLTTIDDSKLNSELTELLKNYKPKPE